MIHEACSQQRDAWCSYTWVGSAQLDYVSTPNGFTANKCQVPRCKSGDRAHGSRLWPSDCRSENSCRTTMGLVFQGMECILLDSGEVFSSLVKNMLRGQGCCCSLKAVTRNKLTLLSEYPSLTHITTHRTNHIHHKYSGCKPKDSLH